MISQIMMNYSNDHQRHHNLMNDRQNVSAAAF
jgi:hypothetical protein